MPGPIPLIRAMVHFHWEEGDISLPSRSVVFRRPPQGSVETFSLQPTHWFLSLRHFLHHGCVQAFLLTTFPCITLEWWGGTEKHYRGRTPLPPSLQKVTGSSGELIQSAMAHAVGWRVPCLLSPVAQTVKNLHANAGDVGWIPGSGRSPGGGNGNPLQYSCLGNPMDRGAWQVAVRKVTRDLGMTERLNNKW